jgi:hypothetical protein
MSCNPANCVIIARFPIENHSEQERFAESPLKAIGKVQILGEHYAIRSACPSFAAVSYTHIPQSTTVRGHVNVLGIDQ